MMPHHSKLRATNQPRLTVRVEFHGAARSEDPNPALSPSELAWQLYFKLTDISIGVEYGRSMLLCSACPLPFFQLKAMRKSPTNEKSDLMDAVADILS